MEYRVKISAKALNDMEAIYDYIALQLQVPDTAMKYYNRIAEAIESLTIFPERCKLFGAGDEWSRGLRRLLVEHYSIFYEVNGHTVNILRVLYSSTDLAQKLNG